MAKALSHPLRTKILARLNEQVASPNELSNAFDESLGVVSYHVRALADLDCIELVDTQPRRGAVEHYYRATRSATANRAGWDQLPRSAKRSFAGDWYQQTGEDVRRAIDVGGFEERSGAHLSLTPLQLDDRAWGKLSQKLDKLVEDAQRLQKESLERLKKGQGEEVRARLVLAQYEGAPQSAGAKKKAAKK